MGMARTWCLALIAAVLGMTCTGPLSALSVDRLTMISEAVDTGLRRAIVLRSVRMPDTFGNLLLGLDADAGMIDRTRDVTNLLDADVWVVGLEGWSDTHWLKTSPLYGLFAAHLHGAAQSLKVKSFQWIMQDGQMMDVHFVNLNRADAPSQTCLAELVYRSSLQAVARRREADLSLASARARPLLAPAGGPADARHCD